MHAVTAHKTLNGLRRRLFCGHIRKATNPTTGSKVKVKRQNAHTVSSSKQVGQRTAEFRAVRVHTGDHTDTDSLLPPAALLLSSLGVSRCSSRTHLGPHSE